MSYACSFSELVTDFFSAKAFRIHFDRDQRVDGSRPNQTDYAFL